jgi:uncharacterized membrane protein YcaP (DUF421 family)
VPATELVVRCAVIYLVLLLALRVFGKRQVGQFTLFDLVFVLLVANAVQPSMTGPDSSLGGGLVIILTLVLLNFSISFIRVRVPWFNRLVEPRSVVVSRGGAWLKDQIRHQGLTLEECEAALREHGLKSVGETTLVVLEADGSLSVVAKDHQAAHRRRHVRFIHHP